MNLKKKQNNLQFKRIKYMKKHIWFVSESGKASSRCHQSSALPKLFPVPLTIVGVENKRPVRLTYQPRASSNFLSEQTSHQHSVSNTFLLEQISTSHQPPAKRTGRKYSAIFFTGHRETKVPPKLYHHRCRLGDYTNVCTVAMTSKCSAILHGSVV
jgi:hypothetical protein